MTARPTLIRDLFLHSRTTYTSAEAAGAIGTSVEDVEGWMEVGQLEGIEERGGVVLPWDELVSFAMGFWEQADIEAALGAELAEALPDLLQLSDLEVRIPRMEVVALETLAARDGKSVDAVLAHELRDLRSVEVAGVRHSRLRGGAVVAVLNCWPPSTPSPAPPSGSARVPTPSCSLRPVAWSRRRRG